jgi:outer membrane protein assembly factor BamB
MRQARSVWWALIGILGHAAALSAQGAVDPTPLFAAAKAGDPAAIEAAVASGIKVNATYRLGVTALHYAAMRGHLAAVEALLRAGAEVDAADTVNHFTALTYAVKGGHCEMVKLLLSRGASPNQRDLVSGLTPLSQAVVSSCRCCLEALLGSVGVARETVEEALLLARRSRKPEAVGRLEEVLAGTLGPPSWPQFRGPNAAGVAYGQPTPAVWSVPAGKNLAWKVELTGFGHSSPVVSGERIFLTTAQRLDGEPTWKLGGPTETLKDAQVHSWQVLCVDARSGQLVWSREVHRGVPKSGRHPFNSMASATPATDGRVVVAILGSEGLYALSVDGELLWQRDLGVLDLGPVYDPDFQWGSASSPILVGDRVIVQVDRQTSSYLAAFALADGRELWRTPRPEPPSWGTPTLNQKEGRSEIVTNGTERVRAYDPIDGKELWSFRTGNSLVTASTPVVGLGLIFVANGFRPLRPIYALRGFGLGELALGENETASDQVAWSLKSGGPYYSTPLLYGEVLYVLTDLGALSAYYAKTGELIYRRRVGVGNRFSASPVAADGKLYLTSEDGEVFVFRAGLEPELLATNPLEEPCMATPAIAAGSLYFRCHRHLFKVAETGARPVAPQPVEAKSSLPPL